MIRQAHARLDALERQRPHLTPQERQILALLVKGHEHKLIGRELGITASTVRGHLQHLADKLGVRGDKRIIARVFALKLVRPPDH